MRTLLYCCLALLLGCSHESDKKTKAIAEIRAATISYITEIEGGTTLDQFDKHWSELKLLLDQDKELLTFDQRTHFLYTLVSAETVHMTVVKAASSGFHPVIKSDDRLLSLTDAQYKQVLQENGKQVVISKAAAQAAKTAKELLPLLKSAP